MNPYMKTGARVTYCSDLHNQQCTRSLCISFATQKEEEEEKLLHAKFQSRGSGLLGLIMIADLHAHISLSTCLSGHGSSNHPRPLQQSHSSSEMQLSSTRDWHNTAGLYCLGMEEGCSLLHGPVGKARTPHKASGLSAVSVTGNLAVAAVCSTMEEMHGATIIYGYQHLKMTGLVGLHSDPPVTLVCK